MPTARFLVDHDGNVHHLTGDVRAAHLDHVSRWINDDTDYDRQPVTVDAAHDWHHAHRYDSPAHERDLDRFHARHGCTYGYDA